MQQKFIPRSRSVPRGQGCSVACTQGPRFCPSCGSVRLHGVLVAWQRVGGRREDRGLGGGLECGAMMSVVELGPHAVPGAVRRGVQEEERRWA